MMLAYRIWTWTAIAMLAFGSMAVFVVFLVTTLRHLGGERSPADNSLSQEKTPPIQPSRGAGHAK
jgi:hypothetical protein